MKLRSVSKSYGKTIMMDNYSFKFGVNLTYDIDEEKVNLDEVSKIIQDNAERIINDDIKRNTEVMNMLGKKRG